MGDIHEARRIHRWNISIKEGEVFACLGAHPNGQGCDEISLPPARMVELIKSLAATSVTLEAEREKVNALVDAVVQEFDSFNGNVESDALDFTYPCMMALAAYKESEL